jgi:hypothetical protein
MGKIRRIRVRGEQRKNPDAALVAQVIIQLGREIWEREERARQLAEPDAAEDERP